MAGRRKNDVIEPFDYDAALARLTNAMRTLHISRIDEMPHIELYLDQLVSIVTDELAPLYDEGEKVVTGSMVNNYVKQQVMPAPTKKRYTRRHLASLLFVCVMKRVLSIAQISQLFTMLEAADADLALSYDQMVATFERVLAARFSDAENVRAATRDEALAMELLDNEGNPLPAKLVSLLSSSIWLVANKVYVEKVLDLEDRKARMQQE